MTFEKAMEKVSKMTEAEKDALGALYLKSDIENDPQIMELLILELDAETQAPTDNIYWITVQQNTLPEGIYEPGRKLLFNVNDKDILCQILECRAVDILAWAGDQVSRNG